MAQKSDADKLQNVDSLTQNNVSTAVEAVGNPQGNQDSIYSCVLANRATPPGGMDMFFKSVANAQQLAVDLHHKAHEKCFIANSVTTEVSCEPMVELG